MSIAEGDVGQTNVIKHSIPLLDGIEPHTTAIDLTPVFEAKLKQLQQNQSEDTSQIVLAGKNNKHQASNKHTLGKQAQ